MLDTLCLNLEYLNYEEIVNLIVPERTKSPYFRCHGKLNLAREENVPSNYKISTH